MLNKLSPLLLVFVTSLSVVVSAQVQTGRSALGLRELKLEGCVQLIEQDSHVIRSGDELSAAIRKDRSRDHCLSLSETLEINFATEMLVGINVNSGYCRRPPGLSSKFEYDIVNSRALITVRFNDPEGSTCAALSRYDYWIIVPHVIPEHAFEFRLEAVRASVTKDQVEN